MSTLGTFDAFNSMRLGIYAAQQGLRVTGNNISNINTVGYTRQRADQVSFRTGGSDRYSSMIDKKVGNGVLISGINQIRDPFLDIRYRNASNDTYHYDTWLAGMQDIAAILDEVGMGENNGDGLIYKQLQDLADKLRAYSANPTIENDRLVRNSASSLTDLFHSAASRLDRLYTDTQVDFNNSITAVNEILINIRDLDKSIRDAEIHGDMALELRDERNLQIDKLSQYLDIKVEYSYEDVGSGIQVEKLTIKLNNANPDKSVTTDESILVDGVFCTQLSVPDEKPLANTYNAEYLKDYSYLKEYSPANLAELQDFLNENGITLDDLIPALDENGNPKTDVYYVGTNSVDEAVKVTNDNYTLQLDKLLNSKGEEWDKKTTTWVSVSGDNAPAKAQYAYTINMADGSPKEGDTFRITGADPEEYIVGEDGVPTNRQALLKFIADRLNETGRYPGYTVSASGDQLIFTADNPGRVGVDDGAPANPPNLEINPPNNWLTIDAATVTPGAPVPDDAGTTYDEYGNKTTINYVQVGDQWYKVTIETEHTREIALDDNDTHGIIQAQRELLTEEGEFASQADVDLDEKALTKRGIPYYQKSLDLLAQKFAEAYNELNQGYAYNQDGYYIDKDGNPLVLQGADGIDYNISIDGLNESQMQNLINNNDTLKYILTDDEGYFIDENGNRITDEAGNPLNKDNITSDDFDKLVVDMNQLLKDLDGYSMGGVLFSNGNNGDDTTGINAHNIDISYGWSNGKWNLVPTFKMLFTDEGGLAHSTQNDNADHMLAMIDKGLTYNPRDLYGSDAIGPELFSGSFNDMLSHMMAVEAEDERSTTVNLNTSATILEDLDYRREGVSGVDLNDEAMNMVQYQKAMNAAMRLMTAIDEALERLINNTGVAGR